MATRFLRLSAVALLLPGLTGCSGSDSSGEASSSAASSSAVSSPSASDASPAGTPSTSASGAASSAPAGPRLAGEGYSFALPPGWRDATEQFQEYSELIDAGAVNAAQAGQPFSDNVNVLRNAGQAELPPAQAEHQFVEELGTVATRVQVQPAASVDGVDALHLTGRTAAGEVTTLTDQYIVYVDGAYFVVTFSFGTGTPRAERERQVASMIASWTWG